MAPPTRTIPEVVCLHFLIHDILNLDATGVKRIPGCVAIILQLSLLIRDTWLQLKSLANWEIRKLGDRSKPFQKRIVKFILEFRNSLIHRRARQKGQQALLNFQDDQSIVGKKIGPILLSNYCHSRPMSYTFSYLQISKNYHF